MTPIKRRLLYIFRDDLLRLRITWESGSITLSTGYHVTRKDSKGRAIWDGSRCKANTTHGKDKIPATIINKVLQGIEDKVEQVFYHFEMDNKVPTKEEFKTYYRTGQNEMHKDFETALNEFMSESETARQWSEGSARQYQVFKKILLYVHKEIGLSFETLSTETQNDIVRCLTVATSSKRQLPHFDDKNRGYHNLTINTVLNVFRSFIRWAYTKGYVEDTRIISKAVSLKIAQRPVIYLTWEEVMKIYNHDFSNTPTLDQAKNFFLFSCFTSLRFSDIHKARWEDIGNGVLRVTIKKTGTYVDIDLNKYSSAILETQKQRYTQPDGYIFPHKLNNSTLNHQIKIICKICGIDKPISKLHQIGSNRYEETQPKYKFISIHTGRRTFIVNALSMGIPPRIVMEWTGHSDYNAMKPYIAITSESRKQAMKKFDFV